MSAKVGDVVRYLNATGGGRVLRIDGNIAYVDEDGFETPVLLRECVVVGASKFETSLPRVESSKASDVGSKNASTSKATEAVQTQLPVIETKTGDVLNLVLGFEASNLKALSQSSFQAYLVNDSNYFIYITLATRARTDSEWTLRYDGLVEPNIQEYLFELQTTDLPALDRIAVQYVAFKRGKEYGLKKPGCLDLKVDSTKFAKLHCFRPNPYFEAPVIAFDLAVNDDLPVMPELDAATLNEGIRRKKQDVKRDSSPAPSKPAREHGDTIVVDLHASELLDNTSGLSPADILNMQVDRFCEVMDANLRKYGQKIVFIHGKGEGVLRQALMKELTHRYKGHDVQDASFREYGFGATQVTIRRTENGRRDDRPHKSQRR